MPTDGLPTLEELRKKNQPSSALPTFEELKKKFP